MNTNKKPLPLSSSNHNLPPPDPSPRARVRAGTEQAGWKWTRLAGWWGGGRRCRQLPFQEEVSFLQAV